MRVLIITGSRAIADEHRAGGPDTEPVAWAREYLRRAMAVLDPAADLIIVGDARGVDAVARAEARARGLRLHVYALDGFARSLSSAGGVWRWAPEGVARPLPGSEDYRRWPLERNAAMVRAVVSLAAQGHAVRGVALYAPWARSGGTRHTAAAMERAGLQCSWLVCPVRPPPAHRVGGGL